MDFTKFLALLEESSLHFPSLHVLCQADPYEGYLAEQTVREGNEYLRKAAEKHGLTVEGPAGDDWAIVKMTRKNCYVSCWHMSDHESVAMWNLYGNTEQGIGIQSTVGSLTETFQSAEQGICMGLVKYIDFSKDNPQIVSGQALALQKRKSFEHEKELRIITLDFNTQASGLLIRVDLSHLIQRVYVAPSAPPWLHGLTEKVAKRYELKADVIQSNLNEKPLY